MKYVEVDEQGYFVCDAPFATETKSNLRPYLAPDGTTPEGMRKARYINDSWIDEEGAQLAVDLENQIINKRKKEIATRLQEIDIESIRALRAQKIGRGSQPDIDKLTTLEDEAELLRMEVAGL